MTIKEFKDLITRAGLEEFAYGISEPFSWRGSYYEVAFAIVEEPMSKSEMLRRIDLALTEEFYGYKGGQYRYSEHTYVHFEDYIDRYTDGKYCAEWIAKLEDTPVYKDQEIRLVNLILQ